MKRYMTKKDNLNYREKQSINKATPTFLKSDYPYKSVEESITDLNSLILDGVYEIKCPKCDMSIRSQGKNIRSAYERLKNVGCIGCGNKDLIIRHIDMNFARNH